MVAALERPIQDFNDRGTILTKLIMLGENLSTELFRDKVEKVKELNLDISKISSETGEMNESMAFVEEKQ